MTTDAGTTTVPQAEVVRVRGRVVTVTCPYCGAAHAHQVEYLGRPERRAPGCGILRSAADRAAGYTFRTPTPEGDHR